MKQSTHEIFEALSRSSFRSRFTLPNKLRQYVEEKGVETVTSHAHDLLTKRVAPANPHNDGRQTPMKNHPVFIAQHATACCCRGCIAKWHGIPKGRELEKTEIDYLVSLVMEWIQREMNRT
jgi:hypothetical protein